jgi:CBS domain-containing protein
MLTVAEIMERDPVTVSPEDSVDSDTSVQDAAKLIAERRHNRLPVVEHGSLVGVVTRLDVLEALVG